MSELLTCDIAVGDLIILIDGPNKFDLMVAYMHSSPFYLRFVGFFGKDNPSSCMTFVVSVTSAVPQDFPQRNQWKLEGRAVKGTENMQCARKYRAVYRTDTRKGTFEFIE